MLILGGQEFGKFNPKIELIDILTKDFCRIGPDLDTSIPLQSSPSSVIKDCVYMFLDTQEILAINISTLTWEKIRLEIEE